MGLEAPTRWQARQGVGEGRSHHPPRQHHHVHERPCDGGRWAWDTGRACTTICTVTCTPACPTRCTTRCTIPCPTPGRQGRTAADRVQGRRAGARPTSRWRHQGRRPDRSPCTGNHLRRVLDHRDDIDLRRRVLGGDRHGHRPGGWQAVGGRLAPGTSAVQRQSRYGLRSPSWWRS